MMVEAKQAQMSQWSWSSFAYATRGLPHKRIMGMVKRDAVRRRVNKLRIA